VQLGNRMLPVRVTDISGPREGDRTLVLIDVSESMAGDRLRAVKSAIRQFIGNLDQRSEVTLVTFAGDVALLVPATSNRQILNDGLTSIVAGGNTALFDGIDFALGQGADRIIVLSDGADTASRMPLIELNQRIRESGTIVDIVAVESSIEQRGQLESITDAAGGRLLTRGEFSVDLLQGLVTAPVITGETSTPWDADLADQPVIVSVTLADGRTFSGRTTVPAEAGWVLAQSPTEPARAIPWIIAITIFVAVGGAVWFATLVARQSLRRHQMDRVLSHYETVLEGPPSGWGRVRAYRTALQQRFAQVLDDAGITVSPNLVLVIGGGFVFLAGAFFGLITPWLIPVGIGAAVGFGVLFLRNRVAANRRQFESELPDFLTLIASGLRSGLSFAQAVASAAKSGSDTLARQMRRVTAEVSVGVDLADALERVADRMESEDLRWTVQALRVQQEVGGSLSRIMEIAAATIRERAQLRREVRTLSAEGRLSAIFLLLLPVAIFVFFVMVRPEYIAMFWTETIGWFLLGVLVVMLVIGTWWMRRITEIRV
jgi:tight adherence protein B